MIVNLKAGPGLREIAPTLGPLLKAWRATAASYTDQELQLLLEFQGRSRTSCEASWPGWR